MKNEKVKHTKKPPIQRIMEENEENQRDDETKTKKKDHRRWPRTHGQLISISCYVVLCL